MGAYINNVELQGNIVYEPKIAMMPSGNKVCTINIGINSKMKNKEGKVIKEEVTFIDIEVFNIFVEKVEEYKLGVGDTIFVKGRIKQNRWENKEGKRNSKIVVVVGTPSRDKLILERKKIVVDQDE